MNLTIERIIAGYKASNLTPKIHTFVERQGDGTFCGCAVSAVLIGEGHITLEDFDTLIHENKDTGDCLYPLAEKAFGADPNTLWEFIYGFDQSYTGNGDSPAREIGLTAHQKIFVEKVLENDNS